MVEKFVSGLIMMFCFSMAAHAEGTVVVLSCHRAIIGDTRDLEKVHLDGVVVRPAVKERCTGDDKSVEIGYYSPVRLTNKGVCKSAVYDDHHKPTEIILRAVVDGKCPVQEIARYAQTEHLSDNEYLAIAQYWKSLRANPKLLTGKIPRGNPTDTSEAEATRALTHHLIADLMSGAVKIQRIVPFTDDERGELAPRSRALRAYHVDAGVCYRVDLIVHGSGFEVARVGCLVP